MMQGGVLKLIQIVDFIAILAPYVVSAFLGGVLLMGWRGEIEMKRQYEARLEEAEVRLEVLEDALTLATATKFHAADAKREVIRRRNRERATK